MAWCRLSALGQRMCLPSLQMALLSILQLLGLWPSSEFLRSKWPVQLLQRYSQGTKTLSSDVSWQVPSHHVGALHCSCP